MPKLLISAGESSGDERAAALVRELRALSPGIEVFGMGGLRLAEAGCRIVVDNSRLHVMGFAEVLAKFWEVRAAFRAMVQAAEKERSDVAVLVDYPGFNMRLAAKLKRLGVHVLYYVSPQVWAWMPGRTKKMGRLADKVLTLFPFEKELYDRANVPAECVGHPLGDELPGEYPAKAPALRKELDLENGQELLALLPGSRPMELKRHLEVFARAASLIRQARPGVRPVLAVTKETPREEIRARAKAAAGFEIPVFAGRTREVLAAADLAVVVSGTATLETALLGCPMIVCYRTGWLNYCLGRLLVTIPCIALANVVAGRAVAPELWQGEVNPARVAESVLTLFEDQEARGRMRAALLSIRENLGPRQGSRRAAEAMLAELRKGAPA